MEQELPADLGERQTAKLIEQHEVKAAETVGDSPKTQGKAQPTLRDC